MQMSVRMGKGGNPELKKKKVSFFKGGLCFLMLGLLSVSANFSVTPAVAAIDQTAPVVIAPAAITIAASSSTGVTATVAPALASTLTAHDAALWRASDGWSNGGMFQVGWRADHVSFANGNLVLKLDNQPTCATTSSACSNQAYASGEYKSLHTISHGRLTFRAKPARGSGVVTGLFTYTGTSGTANHDEIDIEFLGKDTTGVQFNYFVAGVGGHEFWLPLGFDAALAFHDYSIEWLPNAINWYVDGVLKHTVNAGAGVALPSRPQNIFMNLWASTGVNAWTGAFVYTAPVSAEVRQISYKPQATAAFSSFLNGATATDNVGVVGDITNDVPVTLPVGTTTVAFTATDAAGNQGSAISTVTVSPYVPPDTTKPVITLNGINPSTVEAGQPYVDALATVTDNVDPTNAKLAGVSTVNTSKLGNYTVTYHASDIAGNAAIPVVRTVNVVDTTNPILTVPADVVTNATGVRTAVAIGQATATDFFAVTISNNAPADFIIGTTPVTWTASDANGRVSSSIQQVTVNSVSTKPAVVLNSGATVSITAPAGETVFNVATAAAPLTLPAGVTFPSGTLAYSVTSPFAGSVTMTLAFSKPLPPVYRLYKVDNAGVITEMPASAWTQSGTNTINLTLTDGGAFDLDGLQNGVIVDPIAIGVDTQAPVITLTGAATITVAQGSIFADSGTVVTDNVDTGLIAAATGTVNTSKVGTYTLTYNVSDTTGNAAQAVTRTVQVTDQTAPIVTAPKSITVYATSASGTAATNAAIATFLGAATATDNVGIVGAVSNNAPTVFPVGQTTTVTFTAKDAAGNSGTASATVMVTAYMAPDTMPPVITLTGGDINKVQGTAFSDPGYSAIDNPGAMNLTGKVIVTGGPVNSAAAVGTIFTLKYNVSDAAGNLAVQKRRIVTIVAMPDTIAPVITVIGGNATVVQGQTYTDAGASALDNVDGNLTGSITINNLVNTSAIGTYTVTYHVVDAAGNVAIPVVRTVNVIADQPPVMTLIGATPVTLVQGAIYNDGGATAWDDVDGNVTANIATLNHVNTAIVGSYTVTYNVSDAAGHTATQMVRTVNVIPVGGAANRGETVQVPLTGSATAVEIASVSEVISNFSSVTVSGTPPAGVSIPLGVLSYTTTIPAGTISHTVDLAFSTSLPANVVLYKVDNAGNYTVIPNGTGVDQWTQVNATTIALTLSDGGPFDLGGNVPDGIIIDPVAVGVPPVATPTTPAKPTAGGSGGGCALNPSLSFDPSLLLLLLFAFIGPLLRPKTPQKFVQKYRDSDDINSDSA